MSDSALQYADDSPVGSPAGDGSRAEVQEVVRGFGKALRTHLLYEGSGPALDKFVEGLQLRMEALWERLPQLTVGVEEHVLLWEGTVVYQGEGGEDLAFLLYKDGVRELTFLPGFEETELLAFVAILARIHRLRADEEDLLTLLWDADWLHFRYSYVEALPEGVHLPGGSGVAARPTTPPAEETSTVVSSVSREDFQEALYFLDEGELRRLDGELRLEMDRDLWSGVLNALFDRLQDGSPARQEQVVSILSDVLPTLLGAGKLDFAGYVLGELVKVATGGAAIAPAVFRSLRALFEQLAQPETVNELIRTVEEAGDAIPQESLSTLLAYFPPDALAPLLRAGEVTAVPGVRSAVIAAAERLAGSNQEQVVRLVSHEDPVVAGGAARLVGRLRLVTASGEVARLLQRPEAVLRTTAVEALQELRSPTASGALEQALEDPDREVRVAAARALAALRYAPAKSRLEAAIDGKRLREADLTERIAFFEAFGELAGETAIPLLERMLNGKSWLGRRETPETRACAALALGKVRRPAAEQALTAAAADPDPVVRSAVGRALRAIRS